MSTDAFAAVPKVPTHCEVSSKLPVEWYLEKHGLEKGDTGCLRWVKTNPRHPRNWSPWRKTYDFGLLIFMEFFTTAISTAGTPASEQARTQLGMERSTSLVCFVSVYMFGQAIGSVFFPPYSETFGRRKLFIAASVLYCAFSIVVAAVRCIPAIVVGRLVMGLASALPTIVTAGSAEDMFDTTMRVWMIFVWNVSATVGICMGPILGAFVTAALGWHWVFYISAIVTGLLSFLLIGIKESRPSQLLAKALDDVRNESGDHTLRINNPDHAPDIRTFARVALIRPIYLFCTEPIVFVCSLLSAVTDSLLYLFTEALPVVYASFDFTPAQASLAFIPLALGICSGTLTRLYDHRMCKSRLRAHKRLEPEDKLASVAIGAPLLAVGLWWFAWTIPPGVRGVHWIVSMVPLVLVGYAANEISYTLAGYVADSYTVYAASAFASLSFLRGLCSACFPLFAHRMYTGVNPNVASSVLAALSTVFCLAPAFLLFYGRRLRKMSSFAEYSLEQYYQNDVDGDPPGD